MSHTEERVLTRLYHGTSEPFQGDPTPADYDGVFWTAEHIDIARIYIPASGLSMLLGAPSEYELNDWIRPERHSSWTTLALYFGYPMPDCDLDTNGNLKSWSTTGWAKKRDIIRHIEALGYQRNDNGVYWLKEDLGNAIRPANWRKPGRIFSTAIDPKNFNFLDLRHIDFSFADPIYHRIDIFQRAESRHYDGVIINDMAKDADGAFISHISYGFFNNATKRLTFEITPSTHQTIAESMTTGERFAA